MLRSWLFAVLWSGVLCAMPSEAGAQDVWCRADTVESQLRKWAVGTYGSRKQLDAVIADVRGRLARDLLGQLATQVDPRYEAEVLALTGRVQLVSANTRKPKGGSREVCVVVQMAKGGLLGEMPSDVGRELLAKWSGPVATFAAGRPLWIREVALRDGAEPQVDDVVVPRIEDLVRRSLVGVPRWEPTGGAPPADVVTVDVRVTPYPSLYAIEAVARDAQGVATSVGAELARVWLGEVGTRLPLSSRDVAIAKFDGPATVLLGTSANLTWEAPNARRCVLTPAVGDVPPRGKVEVRPTVDTTYTLTCTDGLHTVSRDRTLAVRVPPPQVFLAASPETVLPGGTSVLSWQGVRLATCALDGGLGEGGPAGQAVVRPEATGVWTVRCKADDGSTVTSSVTVTLGAAPPPMFTLVVRSVDSQWVDVRVDGGLVGKLYNEAEVAVELPVGPHRVDIVPFMAEAPVSSVKIDGVPASGRATLGASSTAPIVCYDVTCAP